MVHWGVHFGDGSYAEFYGFWKDVIRQIDKWCDDHGVITTGCDILD